MKENYIKFLAFIAILHMVYSQNILPRKLHELMTPKERHQIFKTDGNKEPKYEIVSIRWLEHHKRPDDSIVLSLTAFNKEINLNLKKPNYLLVGPNTTFYDLETKQNGTLCHKTLPFSNVPDEFYEDEDNLASVALKVDANGVKRIETGVIAAQNITIHQVPKRFLRTMGTSSDDDNMYIIQKATGIFDTYPAFINSKALLKGGSSSSYPDVVYPEVLLMVDHEFLANTFDADDGGIFASTKYLMIFWSQVNMLYRNLDKPKYKISIAGIVIGYDDRVYKFITRNSQVQNGENTLYYDAALTGLEKWLYIHRNCVPLDSYDVAVFHTTKKFRGNLLDPLTFTSTVGIAGFSSACKIDQDNKLVEKVALIYDNCNFDSISVGAHELAHTLGADHDSDQCAAGDGYMMSALLDNNGVNKYKWSQCSLEGFEQFLRATNPSCLYNVPEQYNIKAQNDNKYKNNDTIIDDDDKKNKPSDLSLSTYLNKIIPGTNTTLSDIDLEKPILRRDIAKINNIFVMDPLRIPPNKIMVFLLKNAIINLYVIDRSEENDKNATE